MVDNLGPAGDHPTLPAGYTYLGQFIDHDLTLDLTPLGDGPGGVISNFRSPRLDLDSLYGLGPGGTPFLYRHDDPQMFAHRPHRRRTGPTTCPGRRAAPPSSATPATTRTWSSPSSTRRC